MAINRRSFTKAISLSTGALLINSWSSCQSQAKKTNESNPVSNPEEMFFKISLAQWSLNRELFGGKLDNLDFAGVARNDFGLDAIEYVNQFFKDRAEDFDYLKSMNQRAADNDVKNLLIMIDGEGGLGDPDHKERNIAIENHHKWVKAAKYLGCHSIRVNAFGIGTAEDVQSAAIDGLGRLSEYAAKDNINVIVENHGGYSSDGQWLSEVMKQVNLPNCGTLPDFGNFCIERDSGQPWGGNCVREYDKYQGVEELMPFAKSVSAKAHDFDDEGNEKTIDFHKMMKIVKEANFTGYVGIEYEGQAEAYEGIRKTMNLLKKVGKELSK